MKAPEIDLLCEIELARFQAAEHFKAEAATWRLKIGLGSAGMQAFRETCVCVCVCPHLCLRFSVTKNATRALGFATKGSWYCY